jgi:hypothetical protein
MVTYPEVILGLELPAGEPEICCEISASPVKHRIAGRPSPDKSCQLNRSMQHLLIG